MEALLQLARFLFVVITPFVLVLGAVVTLFAVGALFDALDHPDEIESRIQALFRQPLRKPAPPPKDSYYRTYWSAR
jgi:hypothetical protein